MEPNQSQQKLIESLNGIYLVDAGPGTGKTATLVKRYENLLKHTSPKDILLVTFTNNAAENMRSKIINTCSSEYSAHDLMNAPISTFHAFCNKLLKSNGFCAPKHLGINDSLSRNYAIVEDNILEDYLFRKFFIMFQKKNSAKYSHEYGSEHNNKCNSISNNGRYNEIFAILNNNHSALLSIIKRLCSKGIFPKTEGWFGDGEKLLHGSWQEYEKRIAELNSPQIGQRGFKNSKLYCAIRSKYKKNDYLSCPKEDEIFKDKIISTEILNTAFAEDRKQLASFLHDAYFGYIRYMLKINKLNFDFIIMLAYVLLYNDAKLRNSTAFQYVMVDEFQDTNETQFQLLLLLMRTNNLCAVGDWKQGIYGFRNATIDNILSFGQKISGFKEMLNKDEERITFSVSEINKIALNINYRSSQKILDFCKNCLLISAIESEEFGAEEVKKNIVPLSAAYSIDSHSTISFIKAKEKEDEIKAILTKIQEIVNNGNYLIIEYSQNTKEYTQRKILYQDIAVLSRTKQFGLELQKQALKYNIPVNYEGGIELFRTQGAILTLAWLKILQDIERQDGWIPILEKEGYSHLEKKEILENKRYPASLLEFRNELAKFEKSIDLLVDRILSYYNISDSFANAMLIELKKLFLAYPVSINDLINFIEQNIEEHSTYSIDLNSGQKAVTVQTIHGSKGLEYPVCFIVDCNKSHFPSTKAGSENFEYNHATGIRLKKIAGTKNSHKLIFKNWKSDFLLTKLNTDYDEERRLLFVAATRAKQYLFFTANSGASPFFEGLAQTTPYQVAEPDKIELKPVEKQPAETSGQIIIKEYEPSCRVLNVHDLISITSSPQGHGKDFGKYVHAFAFRYANNLKADSTQQVILQAKPEQTQTKYTEPEIINIKNFISNLKATKMLTEIECSLPAKDVLIRGIIDLVAFFTSRIEVIDYKTDMTDLNENEYRKQLSVYYHVVARTYPNIPVICKIFYVSQNKIKVIEPLTMEELYTAIKASSK